MTHLISTPATEITCPRCGAQLLTAIDEGIRVRVDAEPLPDRPAEIAALLTGRITYTHLRDGGLAHRTAGRIAADSLAGPVHAEHKCARPTPPPTQLTFWSKP